MQHGKNLGLFKDFLKHFPGLRHSPAMFKYTQKQQLSYSVYALSKTCATLFWQ